ncbi:protein of unknown function DUF1624 [Kipferlia bialata]|uniref:Heparan-alpha-glucosaminide N-acetyltransferase catalytic domain-containing protein n=1 Tax=Kipferlia bialata TaxID=797122 RepID=A0A9K3GHZ6_9EUKA|nr:protein of unknown function DUF1624 [Kipferlia bialata]|eukprot:g6106.t1
MPVSMREKQTVRLLSSEAGVIEVRGVAGGAGQRLDSVDVMRGISLICMVVCHCSIFTSDPEGSLFTEWAYFTTNDILGDWPAAVFLFLAGVSQAISLSKQSSSEDILDGPGRRMIKRGLLVMLIGEVVYTLSGPNHIGKAFVIDILTLTGFSMLVLCCVRSVLLAFLGSGEFPVFPYLSMPLIGYAYGQTNMVGVDIGCLDRLTGIVSPICLVLSVVGSSLAATGWFGDTYTSVLGAYCFYPNTLSMILLQAGITAGLMYWCRRLFDIGCVQNWFVLYCRRISSWGLTVYSSSLFLIFWPQYVAGLVLHNSANYYYMNALSPVQGAVLGVVLCALYYPILGWWETKGRVGSPEWVIAKLTPKGPKRTAYSQRQPCTRGCDVDVDVDVV